LPAHYADREALLVNEYIAQAAGGSFTAKDFRTWAGTVACALAMGQAERASSTTDATDHAYTGLHPEEAAVLDFLRAKMAGV
jgi:DNA topoisomerase-1